MENAFDLALRILAPAMDFCPIGPDDYEKDGIIHCALCHTPRQMWLEVLGEKRLVRIMCRCKGEELDRINQEEKARKQRERVAKWRNQGITDAKWHGCRFESDDLRDQKASAKCRKYADNFDEMFKSDTGLMLYGDVGSGKTFLAACVANQLLEEGKYILMANLPSLIAGITADFGENRDYYLEKIARAHLLVLDDFGVERTTEFSIEQTYEIINARYKSGKPMLITTNLTIQEMRDEPSIGKRRIYDRVAEKCIPMMVQGESRRKAIALEKRKNAAKLLEEGEPGT